MKFYIRRTSGAEPPCPEAFMDGENGYYIEIKTLKGLMSLVEKHGDIVLSAEGIKYEPEIEIYDNYRE
jgi:hypothetical protein